MRILSILALTAGLVAQSPLTTTFADNNGGAVGGAVYFDLTCTDPVGINITDIDLNFQGAGGLAGSIDIYTAPVGTASDDPTGWALASNTAVAATAAAGTPTAIALSSGLEMAAGCSFRVAIVANGFAHAYTTGGAGFPLQYLTSELTLDAGQASNVPFAGPLFDPRVVNTNITYTPLFAGTCPSYSAVAVQGAGCVAGAVDALYEDQIQGANDLVGLKINGINGGSQYVVTVAPGTTQPLGQISTTTSLNGLLPDDGVIADPQGSGLNIGSNGWIGFGDIGGGFTPAVADLLAADGMIVSGWTDLDPTDATSNVDVEFDGRIFRITYNAVVWGTPDLALMQIDYNLNTGDWCITIEIMPATAPETQLVGFMPAEGAMDLGPADISGFATSPGIVNNEQALSLDADNNPIQVSGSATPITCTTRNISGAAVFHIGWVGLNRPGIPLAVLNPAIDPGCFAHADILAITDVTVLPGPTVNWNALTLPDLAVNNAIGFEFNTQAATFDPGVLNANTRTSNGLKYTVGDQ